MLIVFFIVIFFIDFYCFFRVKSPFAFVICKCYILENVRILEYPDYCNPERFRNLVFIVVLRFTTLLFYDRQHQLQTPIDHFV